jgi:predicted transcriptional regulator
MANLYRGASATRKRHSLMARDRELPPPLEMMCLNALWEIGEGNTEEVRKVVSQGRPLAYTTVLTLLERLAARGAVSRRKEGRAFHYQPAVERDKLRRLALVHFLEYHFEGSEAKLKIFLEPLMETQEPETILADNMEFVGDSAFAAVAGRSGG